MMMKIRYDGTRLTYNTTWLAVMQNTSYSLDLQWLGLNWEAAAVLSEVRSWFLSFKHGKKKEKFRSNVSRLERVLVVAGCGPVILKQILSWLHRFSLRFHRATAEPGRTDTVWKHRARTAPHVESLHYIRYHYIIIIYIKIHTLLFEPSALFLIETSAYSCLFSHVRLFEVDTDQLKLISFWGVYVGVCWTSLLNSSGLPAAP